MPPRTKTSKTSKGMKENAGVSTVKNKHKTAFKSTKPVRKVLGDKKNSPSDDNASVEIPKKVMLKSHPVKRVEVEITDAIKPRRERRLPSRFADNDVLKNLSSSKENVKSLESDSETSPFKTPQPANTSLHASRPRRICRLPSKFEDHSISPSKYIPVQPCNASTPIVQKKPKQSVDEKKSTAVKSAQQSATRNDTKRTAKRVVETNNNIEPVNTRPQRTRRVIKKDKPSPNNSSTIVVKKAAVKKGNAQVKESTGRNTIQTKNAPSPKNNQTQAKPQTTLIKRAASFNKSLTVPTKIIPTKNNQIKTKSTPQKNPVKKTAIIKKIQTPIKTIPTPKKNAPRHAKKSPINFSFRMLENKKASDQNKNSEDVYEFTFDPKDEPVPQKKKRKVVAKQKPAKPKTVIVKNNYDLNMSKTLTALKNAVNKKTVAEAENVETVAPIQQKTNKNPALIQEKSTLKQNNADIQQNKLTVQQKITAFTRQQNKMQQQKTTTIINKVQTQTNIFPPKITVETVPSTSQTYNNLSVPIENIAADLDGSPYHEINYSPVHSHHENINDTSENVSNVRSINDPLNLREELSFFDEVPVASSSMNVSVRHPHASPWRVEFERLPIKWQVNSYVKPNMTPAVECSFVKFDDTKNKNKHVYTNMVPESNDDLPEIVQNDQPNLVQTSIISFYKEVLENSAKKKNRDRSKSKTPAPERSIFDDISSNVNSNAKTLVTPRKSNDKSDATPNKRSENVSNNSEDNEKVSTRTRQKRKIESNENTVPAKTPRKEMVSSKENTFFGFDESEDLENIPKEKENQKIRALRSKARAVLKEINEQTGPTRAAIPSSLKTRPNMDVVNQMYEQLKSAEEAPIIAENSTNTKEDDIVQSSVNEVVDEESQSVHLFEDIELVHHFKPHRKSYGKAKKVTIQQPSSDSDTLQAQSDDEGSSCEEDDFLDLTFEVPAEENKSRKKKAGKKKLTKKQKLSKKELAEAEAWAAGFNSMCEDVEDFPLVVE